MSDLKWKKRKHKRNTYASSQQYSQDDEFVDPATCRKWVFYEDQPTDGDSRKKKSTNGQNRKKRNRKDDTYASTQQHSVGAWVADAF